MKNPQIETWLTKQGVSWHYVPKVALADFDMAKSMKNQARLTKPVNEDTVMEYAVAMLDGYDFPAMVSWIDKAGMHVLCDGIHRFRGKVEAKIPFTDTYVIETDDPVVIDAITRSINVNNGMRPGRSELVQQAVALVERDGMTIKAAAERTSVPTESVARAIRSNKTKKKLAELGESPETFTATELGDLHGLPDKVLKPIASLKRDAGLSTTLTGELVKELRTKGGEDAMQSTVQAWRNRPDIKSRIALTRAGKDNLRGGDRRTRFLTVFTQLRNMVNEVKSLNDLQITNPKDQEKLKQDWEAFRSEFQAVLRG